MKTRFLRLTCTALILCAAMLVTASCGSSGQSGIDGTPVTKIGFEDKLAEFDGLYDGIAEGIPMTSDPASKWKLNDGTLTLFGQGGFMELDPSAYSWNEFREYVRDITVEEGVSTIGTYAFRNFDSLRSVKFTGGSTIGYGAFFGCGALESVDLGDTMEEIGGEAFAGCTSLREITIPVSVWYIWPDAFKDCTSLEKVVYAGTARQWENIGIDYGNELLENAKTEFAPEDTQTQ